MRKTLIACFLSCFVSCAYGQGTGSTSTVARSVLRFTTASKSQLAMDAPLGPVTSSIPQISVPGVVNAASYLGGPIAPGELLAIFGTNLGPVALAGGQLGADGQSFTKLLAGTRVLFDGMEAPILYSSSGQVGTAVPFGVAGKATVTLQVAYNGVISNSISLSTTPSCPGLFTFYANGYGQGAIQNQDGQVNGQYQPARQRSVITVWATGAGLLYPSQVDGAVSGAAPPAPVLPVKAFVNGQIVPVLYAGGSSGSINGLLQVNLQLPPGVQGRVPVQLAVGGATSAAETTVFVEQDRPANRDFLVVSVKPNDIAYDPGANLIYASVNAGTEAATGTIAVIDAARGTIMDYIPCGPDPRRLVVSEDGRYLYVASSGGNSLQRINLLTKSIEFTIAAKDLLPAQFHDSQYFYILDLQPVPSLPRSVAVAFFTPLGTGKPILIVDDQTVRPGIGPTDITVAFSDPGTMWTDRYKLRIDGTGISIAGRVTCPLAFHGRVQVARDAILCGDGGRLGYLIRQSSGEWLGGLDPGMGRVAMAYRPDTDMVYVMGWYSGFENIGIVGYDLDTLVPLASFFLDDSHAGPGRGFHGSPLRLLAAGVSGLAAASPVGVFIYPLSIIPSLSPWPIPRPIAKNGQIRRFAIPNGAMTLSPGTDTLYLSLFSGIGPVLGNTVLPFQITAGTFGKPVWAGSQPYKGAVSTNGRYLYLLLGGAQAIKRLSLPDLTVDDTFRINLFQFFPSVGLHTVPFQEQSIVVDDASYADGSGVITSGSAIFDNGVRRPNNATCTYERLNAGIWCCVSVSQLSADGTTLYGLNNESSSSEFSRWTVDPGGFSLQAGKRGVGTGFNSNLRCGTSICITGSGVLIDSMAMTVLGTFGFFNSDTIGLLDDVHHRAYYVFGDGNVLAFDTDTLNQTGHYTIPKLAGIAHTVELYGDELIIGAGGELILLPVSLVN